MLKKNNIDYINQLIYRKKNKNLTSEEYNILEKERIRLIVKGADWSEIQKVMNALKNN